jgi:ClpP class serine protease
VSRKYAIERGFLDKLRAGRRELTAYARSVKVAEDLRASRDELMASVQIHRTPLAGESITLDIRDGVAHIPVVGQLTPSADPCGAWMGQAETEYGFIQAHLIAAEDDKSVREIALDINSPGGYISGLDETAQLLGAVSKPTTAYVSGLAASAAYWLASQADRIVALSPATEVGSIGVAMEEYDDDAALAADGIAHRVYTSTDAPDKRPDTKTEEGRAKIVAELDALHSVFVRRVAEGRGVSQETVNKDFGRGGVLLAEKAMAVGMVDEVRGSHINRRDAQDTTKTKEKAGVAGSAGQTGKTKQGRETMTLEQLKAEHPDVAQALRDEGIQAERKRVNQLAAWKGQNADADKVVEEAVAAGKTYDDVAPQLVAAVARGNSKQANGDNAPAVTTAAAQSDGLDDIDREAMAMFGTDPAEYRKHMKGAKNG